ncbi:hypothetical protein [Enhygromyxa salina]|uniref:Uncharacterized protein n=1 Tax=Enhygromyxa salina TaxID=215803 RepID=A0A2S9YYS9_9BACT|nr:hypothetical protein [Enhygromyxa salina]PRQ10248.1 hypothetical protein ENSA7_00570 [Enhygromyxa salina]
MAREPDAVQLSGKEKIVGSLLLLAIIIPALFFSFGPELRRQNEREDLLASGQDATATIVSLRDNGNSFNDKPEVEVRLIVHPSGDASEDFQVDITQVMGPVDLANYRVGVEVSVKFDPADRQKLTIVAVVPPTAAGSPAAPTEAAPAEQSN